MSLPLADFASWLPCQQPQGRVLILIDGDTHCVGTSFPDPPLCGSGLEFGHFMHLYLIAKLEIMNFAVR